MNEESADMRTSMAWVSDEVNTLKKACTKPDGAGAGGGGGAGASLTSADANCPGAASLINLSDVQRVVSRTIGNMSEKKCIICCCNGPIPENENGGTEEDAIMFTMFCEENLSIKPVIADTGCQRLGKHTDQRPRKLLIYLMSEYCAHRKNYREMKRQGVFILTLIYHRLNQNLHLSRDNVAD